MDFNEVKEKIQSFQKGSIHKITYSKQLETYKGCKDIITKKTSTYGKFGIKYDKIKDVYNARNTGDLPPENQGLPAGTEWFEYPYFIKSLKTGAIQLRVAKGGSSNTTYYKNNQEITRDEAKKLCQKREFPDYKKDSKPHPIFNIGVSKIISID